MRGFTTVEMIVVMVLTAILAAVALPRLTARTPLQERGARDHVKGMLTHVRQVAVAQQRETCVLATPTQVRASNEPYLIDMPTGVAMGGAAQVRFNARGQPVPAANATLTVGNLTLTVTRETGLVQ